MIHLRIVLAVMLGLFSGWAVASNYVILAIAARGRHISMIPVVGGLVGAAAVALAPWRYSPWWAIPLILDPGCALMVAGALVHSIWRRSTRP
jgi:hypothetical protein